jgi:hypothetical protein
LEPEPWQECRYQTEIVRKLSLLMLLRTGNGYSDVVNRKTRGRIAASADQAGISDEGY